MAMQAGMISKVAPHASNAMALAAIPTGSTVAIFESRADAVAAGVQLLTRDQEAIVWVSSGRSAALAIRDARGARSLPQRLLHGFGDQELAVRSVLGQAENGRSVLVIKPGSRTCLSALDRASHVYQFGHWTIQPIR